MQFLKYSCSIFPIIKYFLYCSSIFAVKVIYEFQPVCFITPNFAIISKNLNNPRDSIETIIKQHSSQWVYNQTYLPISIIEASIYDVLEIKSITFLMEMQAPLFWVLRVAKNINILKDYRYKSLWFFEI